MKVVTEFGGQAFKHERTHLRQSDDTLQRIFPILSQCVEPAAVGLGFLTCKIWQQKVLAQGFCHKTIRLCARFAQECSPQSLPSVAVQPAFYFRGERQKKF